MAAARTTSETACEVQVLWRLFAKRGENHNPLWPHFWGQILDTERVDNEM